MANWRRGSNGHDPTEHQHEKANRKEPNGRLITLRSQLLGAFPVAAANSLLHGSNFQLFFLFWDPTFSPLSFTALVTFMAELSAWELLLGYIRWLLLIGFQVLSLFGYLLVTFFSPLSP